MASWLTCALCGVVQEVSIDEPMPRDWKPTANGESILCPDCAKDSGLEKVARDISQTLKQLDLESALDRVVPPDIQRIPMDAPARFDANEEGYCVVCKGPCQGH